MNDEIELPERLPRDRDAGVDVLRALALGAEIAAGTYRVDSRLIASRLIELELDFLH
jgi:anti-sigma28 factor (negative regulator of flagellin synthesis)